jgi:hypothetical protein
VKELLKGLLDNLPKKLEILPGVIKFIPILIIVGGIGVGVYYFVKSYKDPFKCVDNEIYEQLRFDSNVYKFKGGYCVD